MTAARSAFLSGLRFTAEGLIPAIVQDDESNEVLMMAWMNAESIQCTLDEGRTVFWSRSRQELWRKGETSGNVQTLVSIAADCDADTLLLRVQQAGPACHTGTRSCFTDRVFDEGATS
jgi:phosphoribosyl-AMP cyclohydrolase